MAEERTVVGLTVVRDKHRKPVARPRRTGVLWRSTASEIELLGQTDRYRWRLEHRQCAL